MRAYQRMVVETCALLLGILTAAAGALGTPNPKSEQASAETRAEEAAVLAWEGQVNLANEMAAHLGDTELAVFVRACLALDAGNVHEAKSEPGLSRLRPDALRLLKALTSRRAASPDEDWVTAAVGAWRETGPIDAAAGTPLRAKWTDRAEAQEEGSPRSASDAFWKVASEYSANFSDVVAVRPLASSNLRKLVLVGLLPNGRPGPGTKLRGELIDELVAAEPDDMNYARMRALHGTSTDQPLSEGELAALEDAVTRPRLGASIAGLYDAYRRDLEAVADPDPTSHAFRATIGAFPQSPGELLLRSKATQEAASPVAGPRLAAVLERVGREFAVQTSMVARLLGEQLLVRAAARRGDTEGLEAARARLAETRALYRAGKIRLDYLERWPVLGLTRALVDHIGRDEIALFQELAQLPVHEEVVPASQ